MSRTRTGPAAWVADRVGIRRQARVRAHAQSYLAELLATNSMRVVNGLHAAGAEAVAAELSELAAKRRQVGAIEAALTARGADQQPEEVKPR